jgi:type I restriction enzyme S subunit
MNNGWQTKTLAEACEIKPPKSEARNRLNGDARVSFLPMEDMGINEKLVRPTQVKQFSAVQGSYTYFADGDVLLAKITPCFENGKFGIADGLTNGVGFGSSEYMVFRPGKEITKEWVYYYLSQESFRVEGAARMSGAVGHKRVSKEFIENYPIPVPPLHEQRRIVDILDKAFGGIATAKANAEKNLQNAHALFESHLQAVFTSSGKGWVEKKLGDESLLEIIDGDRGGNYPKASDFLDDGHCLFLNTKNVRPDGFDFQTKIFITAEKDGQLRKGKLKRDDVVLTTRGTIGNIGIYSEEIPFDNIRINSGMLIFRPNKRVLLPSFLFELFISEIVKNQIKKQTTGAAQPQLPIKTLVKFTIPVPVSLDDQRALVKKLRAFEPQTQGLESIYKRKLIALEALKKSLLHQAFTGKL